MATVLWTPEHTETMLWFDPAWAAIYDGNGALWGYGTVSDLLGDGDFKLQETLLLQGAFARLTSATIQG